MLRDTGHDTAGRRGYVLTRDSNLLGAIRLAYARVEIGSAYADGRSRRAHAHALGVAFADQAGDGPHAPLEQAKKACFFLAAVTELLDNEARLGTQSHLRAVLEPDD